MRCRGCWGIETIDEEALFAGDTTETKGHAYYKVEEEKLPERHQGTTVLKIKWYQP